MLDLWASGPPEYRATLSALLVVGAITLPLLFVVSAPYGRHHRAGWGPSMPARWGWVAMELPAVLAFVALVVVMPPIRPWAWLLGALYLLHYLYRSLMFPFRMRGGAKPKPLLTVGIAVLFNLANGACNAFDLARVESFEPLGLAIGLALFALGASINHHADGVLLRLRKPGDTGYAIPYGGLYRYVSAPNYTGELLQWIGFAVAAATPAAAVFAVFTACNLVPRAHSHHAWYHEQFEAYPAQRKRLIPWLW